MSKVLTTLTTLPDFTYGNTILLNDGIYNDINITITNEGTISDPIIIKAKNFGKVFFSGKVNITISGRFIIISNIIFTNGSGNINLSSAVLKIEQRTFSEYLGVISGTASTITKEGDGVLKLKAANTYSGNTILAAGEIIIGVSNALPTASAVSFTGASRLLMLQEGISQGFSSLTSSVPSSSIFGYKKNTFNLNQSGASTFAGGLFGGFSFVKSGDGTLTLTSGAQGSVLTTTGGTVN